MTGQLGLPALERVRGAGLGNSPAGLWQQPPDLAGRGQGRAAPASICRGGKIQLRRDGEEWQLASHDVTFKLDGATWLQSRLAARTGGDRIQGYVPAIDLDQVANLSQLVRPHPEPDQDPQAHPTQGQLQELVLQADGDWQGTLPERAAQGLETRPGTTCPACRNWTATSG